MFAFKFEVRTKKCPCKNKTVQQTNSYRTVWLIYSRHCTPISIKIGQRLLRSCTQIFWCVFMPQSVLLLLLLVVLRLAAVTSRQRYIASTPHAYLQQLFSWCHHERTRSANTFIYIFYSPHYSGRENKRTRNTTKQKNKQYKSTRTDQTL